MARKGRNRKHRKKAPFTLPISVVAGFVPGLIKVYEASRGGVSAMAREAGMVYTGVDFWNGNFNFGRLMQGMMPIVIGVVVHKVATKLGVNRALRGVPIIRL